MHQLCKRFAETMPLHRLQNAKYAENVLKMHEYAKKNTQNMQYWHILHIYVLPTLLMVQAGNPENFQNNENFSLFCFNILDYFWDFGRPRSRVLMIFTPIIRRFRDGLPKSQNQSQNLFTFFILFFPFQINIIYRNI